MTKISLAPRASSNFKSHPPSPSPVRTQDAEVILGWREDDFTPITPTAQSLFGPRGVLLHPDGSLWVCDTGHHRVLGWKSLPTEDNVPADIVLGQPDFNHEGRNGKGELTSATFNVPTGITAWGEGMAVADAWNHRVLLWKKTPSESQQSADLVLGDVSTPSQHREVNSTSLYWPYGVFSNQGHLFVADTGNRRVLIWDKVQVSHQPADLVLGQKNFSCRDENAGEEVGAVGMRWPHDIAVVDEKLVVADAGNNRVMLWDELPRLNGTACQSVIGQKDFFGCDHNQSNYLPNGDSLNMPYGVKGVKGVKDRQGEDGYLWINDTANSRVLIGPLGSLKRGAGNNCFGENVLGQLDLRSKGDNQWKPTSRSSLCWPYGLSVFGGWAAIADSGNNRIMLWQLKKD